MPINPNGTGKAADARETAIKLYENIYDKTFTSKDVIDLGITVSDIKNLNRYEWLTKIPGDRLNTYKLKPDSIELIENYYLSEETKTCTKCGRTKKVSEFNFSKTGKGGLSSYCSECIREETRNAYKEKNK